MLKEVGLFFIMGKVLLKCNDIFTDNDSIIVRDCFATDSVTVTGHLLRKTQGNFSVYQLGSVTSEKHENYH